MPPRNPFDHLTFRQGEFGLWVPDGPSPPPHALGLVLAAPEPAPTPTMILPFRPTVRDGLFGYASESDLGLETLGKEAIQRAFALMPSELTFVSLSHLLSRISRMRQDAAAQLELAREIYGDAPVVGALGAFCAVDGHVAFSEQGLFALMAQAVIHCRHDTASSFTPDEWLAFKRLLLAAPGLLHDDVDLGEYEEGKPEEWLAYMTQNLLFNASTNFGSGLARTWRLFGELAGDPSREWKTPVDIRALEDHVGLSVAQQLALAFGIYAVLGMDTDLIVMHEDGWPEVCRRVAPDRSPDEVISHIAVTPGELRAELTSDEAERFDPRLRWSSVPFLERPFVRLDDGRLLLVSPRGIEGWPTDGVYYRLLRAARDLDPKNGVQHFTSFVGELTEAATIEVVEDAHARANQKHLGIGRVSRARSLKGGGESTDVFVLESGDIVLLEISSSRITAATRLTGDLDALRRDLGKVVVKRVEQLHRTVEAICNAEFDDIRAADVKQIFPVIVNVEPLRWSPMLHAYLRREVPDMLQQPVVRHLQFISLEDLEALLSVLGPPTLGRLLDRKIQEAGIDTEILQWFHDSPLAPRPGRPDMVTERMDRQFQTMVRQLGFDGESLDRR